MTDTTCLCLVVSFPDKASYFEAVNYLNESTSYAFNEYDYAQRLEIFEADGALLESLENHFEAIFDHEESF